METHRIAVISDTHGLLRPECIRVLETCEAILHAGDVGKPEVLCMRRQIAGTYAVRGNAAIPVFPDKDMDRLVRRSIKEMKAGKGIPEIAARVRREEALVEQVCRIYATHPGVDVEGILNRMEIKDR